MPVSGPEGGLPEIWEHAGTPFFALTTSLFGKF